MDEKARELAVRLGDVMHENNLCPCKEDATLLRGALLLLANELVVNFGAEVIQ